MKFAANQKTYAAFAVGYVLAIIIDITLTIVRFNVENWAADRGLSKIYNWPVIAQVGSLLSAAWDALTGPWGFGFMCGAGLFAFWDVFKAIAAYRRKKVGPAAPATEPVLSPNSIPWKPAPSDIERLAKNRARVDRLGGMRKELTDLESMLDQTWAKLPDRIAFVQAPGQRLGMDGDPFYRIDQAFLHLARELPRSEVTANFDLPHTFNPGVVVAGEERAVDEARKYAFRQYAARYRLAKKVFQDAYGRITEELARLNSEWHNAGAKQP